MGGCVCGGGGGGRGGQRVSGTYHPPESATVSRE